MGDIMYGYLVIMCMFLCVSRDRVIMCMFLCVSRDRVIQITCIYLHVVHTRTKNTLRTHLGCFMLNCLHHIHYLPLFIEYGTARRKHRSLLSR